MRPAAVAPLMSSDEVNLLVYAYLAESCLDHSAFTLYSESHLAEFLESNDENPPSVPPTGHLIRILQKGLLYLQAEAKYRGVSLMLLRNNGVKLADESGFCHYCCHLRTTSAAIHLVLSATRYQKTFPFLHYRSHSQLRRLHPQLQIKVLHQRLPF